MKKILFIAALGVWLTGYSVEPVDYVDIFVGTSNSRAMLGPYAGVPYGMVQLGPDNQDSYWMCGYEYAISNIKGFSHIHAWMMNGLMIMPAVQDLVTKEGDSSAPYRGANAGYHSRILKETETGGPGYYGVFLYDADCQAEMTATTRCGLHRYTFAGDYQDARIMLDLQFPSEYRNYIKKGYFNKISDMELEGFADTRAYCEDFDYILHFYIRFNKPFKTLNGWEDDTVYNDIQKFEAKGDCGAFVEFDVRKDESVIVQVALSLVDIDGAKKNYMQELEPYGWDFDAVRAAAKDQWNDLLSKIEVKGRRIDKKRFYTNLYRSFAKQTWNDVDGQYRDPSEKIQTLPAGYDIYGGDAFWNSYWNFNPLLALIAPNFLNNWVQTQIELYDKTGWTNNGPTGLEHTAVMDVTHEIAMMVGAYQKGIRDYDVDRMWEAIRHNATVNGGHVEGSIKAGQDVLDIYKRFGYVPYEYGPASRVMDYSYTDFCTAQMAKALGKEADYRYFLDRSGSWKNQFNPETKWQTPRDSTGRWFEDYNIFSGLNWTEGNGWQYTWYVPHDVEGLVQLMGKDLFNERLEKGFEKSKKHLYAAHAFDRYQVHPFEYYINHGNECNMQAAFLFNYSGKPWLTQKYSRAILDAYYGNDPYNGWQGDEDEGQMSSWFVMSSLGLFEMNGGVTDDPEFDLTSPLFRKMTIKLDKKYARGDEFTIIARNNSSKNIYIQSAKLNGTPLTSPKLKWKDVINGGKLVFIMGDKPNPEWGK